MFNLNFTALSYYQTTVQGQPVPIIADDIIEVTPSDSTDIIHPDSGKPVQGLLQADGASVTVTVETQYMINNEIKRFSRGPITIKDGEFLNVIVHKVFLTGTTQTGATLWLHI